MSPASLRRRGRTVYHGKRDRGFVREFIAIERGDSRGRLSGKRKEKGCRREEKQEREKEERQEIPFSRAAPLWKTGRPKAPPPTGFYPNYYNYYYPKTQDIRRNA